VSPWRFRELDRERKTLENQEKTVVADIKKSAAAGQNAVMRIQAKDLVRTRSQVKKMIQMRSQLQTVSMTIQNMKSTNTMANSLKNVTKAMGRMNKSMNLPQMQSIMQEFEKQMEVLGMKQEVMDDAMDEMGESDDEEMTDEIVDQVFTELGLQQNENLLNEGGVVPSQADSQAAKNEPAAADADLQARLDNLRGGT